MELRNKYIEKSKERNDYKIVEINGIKKIEKDEKNIRIGTYNIHYWTDILEKENFEGIINEIEKINADVMCLQEVSFGKTRYNKKGEKEIEEIFLKMGYLYKCENRCCKYIGSDYGNLILSKLEIEEKKQGTLYKGNVKVRRGYSLIKLRNIDLQICCTHLDVFDISGKIRNIQIAELCNILNLPQNNTILMGDFNCLNPSDYSSDEKNYLSSLDKRYLPDFSSLSQLEPFFKTCWQFSNLSPPPFTVWSNHTIDFIFIPINFPYQIYPRISLSSNSDHFPLFCDIAVY